MHDLIESGGPFFLAVLTLSVLGGVGLLLATALALVSRMVPAAVSPARWLSVGLLLATPLPLIIGVIGTMDAEQMVAEAVSLASTESKDVLWAAGQSIAGIPKMFGFCSSMACLLPASLVCLLVGSRDGAR